METYQFVSDSHPETRRKARQHVMRALRHRKRAQQISAFNKSQAELARLTTSGRRPSLRSDQGSQTARSSEDPNSTIVNSPSRTLESPILQQNDDSDSQVLQSPSERSPDDDVEEEVKPLSPPLTLVGAARTDPFNALPISCTQKEYALINHCRCARLSLKVRCSLSQTSQPSRIPCIDSVRMAD